MAERKFITDPPFREPFNQTAIKKIIHMRPEDSTSVFWDEEGVCIGGAGNLTLHDSPDDENGTTIELHVPGLQE